MTNPQTDRCVLTTDETGVWSCHVHETESWGVAAALGAERPCAEEVERRNIRLAEKPSDPAQEQSLAALGSLRVRLALVRTHRSTGVAHLLANDPDRRVRRAFALAGGSRSAMSTLAADPDEGVRARVAAHRDTPSDVVAALMDDPNPEVRRAAQMNAGVMRVGGKGVAVGVADIGHPDHPDGTSHFGAWLVDGPRAAALFAPAPFGALAGALVAKGHRLVLGVECPNSSTVGDRGVERPEEAGYDRPWYQKSGAVATVLGLSQVPFILKNLAEGAGRSVSATVRPERFLDGEADVLLVEAFVTGAAKPGPPPKGWPHGPNVWDAAAAATTIVSLVAAGGPLRSNTQAGSRPARPPIPVQNLLVSAALSAGLSIDPREITHPGLFIRPAPGLAAVAGTAATGGAESKAGPGMASVHPPPLLIQRFAALADRGNHDEAWDKAADPQTPPPELAAIAAAYPRANDHGRAYPDICEDLRDRVFANPTCPPAAWLGIAEDDHGVAARHGLWPGGTSTGP